jgi:hypothetical protein
MGTLFHDKYLLTPEIWRPSVAAGNERKAIMYSTLLGFLTCGAFVLLCARLGFHAYHNTLKLAVAVWLIAPLPMIITNHLFIKMHPALAVSHSLGWLAKLMITALLVVWIFPR